MQIVHIPFLVNTSIAEVEQSFRAALTLQPLKLYTVSAMYSCGTE